MTYTDREVVQLAIENANEFFKEYRECPDAWNENIRDPDYDWMAGDGLHFTDRQCELFNRQANAEFERLIVLSGVDKA